MNTDNAEPKHFICFSFNIDIMFWNNNGTTYSLKMWEQQKMIDRWLWDSAFGVSVIPLTNKRRMWPDPVNPPRPEVCLPDRKRQTWCCVHSRVWAPERLPPLPLASLISLPKTSRKGHRSILVKEEGSWRGERGSMVNSQLQCPEAGVMSSWTFQPRRLSR